MGTVNKIKRALHKLRIGKQTYAWIEHLDAECERLHRELGREKMNRQLAESTIKRLVDEAKYNHSRFDQLEKSHEKLIESYVKLQRGNAEREL